MRKSKDGRVHLASSSRLRLHRLLLPPSTQGCDRHRSRPWRRPGSGVDAGVLLAEGGWVPASMRCSCERDRRRLEDSGQGPVGRQDGPEPVLPSLLSTKPLLADAGRGARGEVGPAGDRAVPPRPLQRCSVALPALLHHLLETRVQTLEPPGHHGDQHRASSSGSDRDRQCRLVGGAVGGPVLPRRSTALPTPRPVQGSGDSGRHWRPWA